MSRLSETLEISDTGQRRPALARIPTISITRKVIDSEDSVWNTVSMQSEYSISATISVKSVWGPERGGLAPEVVRSAKSALIQHVFGEYVAPLQMAYRLCLERDGELAAKIIIAVLNNMTSPAAPVFQMPELDQ